jgi:hypothetical protein
VQESSVAEPVEQQLLARVGAQVFWPGSGSVYVNSYKMMQKALNFSSKNLKMSSKVFFLVATVFTIKNLLTTIFG